MWTAPPEGVAYEQWLMDQVAMRRFEYYLADGQGTSVQEDAHTAWCDAQEFMAHRQLVDQGRATDGT